jgi:4'-phosphopantetheinyl transferase
VSLASRGAAPEARLRDGGTDLWAVDLAGGAGLLIEFDDRHSFVATASDEGARDPARRAARIALRVILAGYLGREAACRPFVLSRAGKPSLATSPDGQAPGLHFNLAHCDTTALVAVSRAGPVGVDIEAERRTRISDHRRGMLIDWARAIAPLDPLPEGPDDARFLQAWVRLEALAKATGEGLGALLGRLGGAATAIHAGSVTGASLCVRDIPLDGHRLWAAVAGESPELAIGRPAARWLPLEDAWLEHWVAGASRPTPTPARL